MNRLTLTILMTAFLFSCQWLEKLKNYPEVVNVKIENLPDEQFLHPIGTTGLVFDLKADYKGTVEVALEEEPKNLLPHTIRLFRFDEKGSQWVEIEGSAYNEKTGKIAGKDLKAGRYRAIGWSANPVDNALQRIVLDIQSGIDLGEQSITAANMLPANLYGFHNNLISGIIEIRELCMLKDYSCSPSDCGGNCSTCDSRCCRCLVLPWFRLIVPPRLDLCRMSPICPPCLSCPRIAPEIDKYIIPTEPLIIDRLKEIGLGDLIESQADRAMATAYIKHVLQPRLDPTPTPMRGN